MDKYKKLKAELKKENFSEEDIKLATQIIEVARKKMQKEEILFPEDRNEEDKRTNGEKFSC